MIKTATLVTIAAAVLTLTGADSYAVAALTEMQVDKILDMIAAGFRAMKEGISTRWVALAPFLLAYLAFRQAANNKARKEGQQALETKVDTNLTAIAENTELTKEAVAVIAKAEPAPGSSAENPLHLKVDEPST